MVRVIKRMCDEILTGMDEVFNQIYAAKGAPSVLPETLLRGKVQPTLHSVRSDRQALPTDSGHHEITIRAHQLGSLRKRENRGHK